MARPTDRLLDVVGILKEHSISQLPVVDADGRLHGMVTEIDLLNHMLTADHVHDPDETIEDMIDHDVPVVGPNTGLETLMSIFTDQAAVIIVDDGEVQGILTKIDILDYLSSQIR
ncbi:MAG: CBS domain-containing protein [Chloroflexota bacterium]